MLLLDRQSGATTQPRGAASDATLPVGRLQLRLRADGHVLDLLPGKTTIGSSPRCNVRIEQPGVQPLHCLIVEGAEGWRVRSWVANSTLNGEPFEEAALVAGDCLCLGPVELDVFDPEAETLAPQPVLAPKVDVNDAEEIRVGRDRARSRSRQLLKALRAERSTHRRLSEQLVKLQESHLDAIAEQHEVSRTLESCLDELATAREQLRELEQVHASARQDLELRNEQLGFEIGELSAQLHEVSQSHSLNAVDRQRIADEQAELEERLRQYTESHAQLQSEVERLTSEKNATTEQYHRLSDVNARLQSDVLQLADEKAAVDEQYRQLADRVPRLENEVERLANQKENLEAEREGLRRQNEQLLSEAREIAGERGLLLEDQASLRQERSELRQQNESLRARVAQLNDEQSTLAVNNLTLEEKRDAFARQVEQLQAQVKKLGEENARLAAAKSTLAEEQARLVAEQKRLTELEREITAVVAGRENASAELYRALLQISEMQERDDQHKEVITAYEMLRKEHDQAHDVLDQLKSEVQRLSDERSAAEAAWQALTAEAAALGESQQQLAGENATLVASLNESRQQLEKLQSERTTLGSVADELERERAAKLEAEAAAAASLAENERRLEECERRLAEQSQKLAEQSGRFEEQLHLHVERADELAETVSVLEQQLAAASKSRDALVCDQQEAELRLADAESRHGQQLRRIQELELQLSHAEQRAAEAAEIAARQPVVAQAAEAERSIGRGESHGEPVIDCAEGVVVPSALPASQPVGSDWNQPTSGASDWQPVSAEVLTDAIANAESNRLAEAGAVEEGRPVEGLLKEEPEVTSQASLVTEEASSPLDLLWRSAAEQAESESGDSLLAKQAESEPPIKHEPPSFIDRYAHLLDDNQSEAPLGRAGELLSSKPAAMSSIAAASVDTCMDGERVGGSGDAPARGQLFNASASLDKKDDLFSSKGDDEESIEQYMAKLLQRMRGDSEAAKAEAPAPVEATSSQNDGGENIEPAAADDEAAPAAENAEEESVDALELLKRRVSAMAPTTNMSALRALANETARMAISRHELNKLRRSATTKVIVATLAGVTSLWLVLNSSEWRSLSVVAAGVTLFVAVYWVGETFRTLYRLKRAINRAIEVAAMATQVESPALPIDVESDEEG